MLIISLQLRELNLCSLQFILSLFNFSLIFLQNSRSCISKHSVKYSDTVFSLVRHVPIIKLLHDLFEYAALFQLLGQLLKGVLEEVAVLLQLKLADLRLLELVVQGIVRTCFALQVFLFAR